MPIGLHLGDELVLVLRCILGHLLPSVIQVFLETSGVPVDVRRLNG